MPSSGVDNNVLFRDGDVVLVADLEFMGNRRRIEDLALTLYFAGYELAEPTAPAAMEALAGLVGSHDAGSGTPLSTGEKAALPVALARQPLWSIAVWTARLDDERAARRHIRGHLAAVERGLDMLRSIEAWRDAFQ